MQKARVILISGERGSGKSALVRRLAALARGQGQNVAGLVTMEVYAKARKVGITVRDLRTGRQGLLAEQRDSSTAFGPETQEWRFHEGTLAWSDAALLASVPCDLLVVDELGPLELERGDGWQSALDVLCRGEYGRALVVVRPSLLDRFYELCPALATRTVMLSEGTRDEALAELSVELGVAA